MTGGMEATAKLFGSRPPCPNCHQPLSDSEMSLQQANGPLPLCFKCYAKTSAEHSKQRAFKEHGHDTINHPTHYNIHPSGIECIEITRHMNFNLGNAIKYIWRVNEKGDSIENLHKAIWYLNDEITRLTKKDNP